MTTIATDGQFLATDSAMFQGTTRAPWSVPKYIIEDDRIFVFSGAMALFEPMVDWYKKGLNKSTIPQGNKNHKDDEDWGDLWVFEGGHLYEISNKWPYKLKLNVPVAMGSGGDIALAILTYGGTVLEAIQVAVTLNSLSGGPVECIELPPELRVKKPSSFMPLRPDLNKNGA
jgi:hypothetical protein